jgi:hypothetical protein
MSQYRIVKQANDTFGVQRAGSNEVHGSFDTWAEAAEAIGLAGSAQEAGLADPMHY